jgi:hypothetical protein
MGVSFSFLFPFYYLKWIWSLAGLTPILWSFVNMAWDKRENGEGVLGACIHSGDGFLILYHGLGPALEKTIQEVF